MGIFDALFGGNKAEQGLADASAGIGAGYDKAIAGYQPYIGAGQNALSKYLDATGQGNSAAGLDAFKSSPIYQLLSQSLNLGDTGVLSRAAGSLNSGNTIRAVNDYNGQQANSAFGNWLNGLGGTATQGYDAMGRAGQLGVDKATTQGQIRAQIGQVQDANGLASALDGLTSDVFKGFGFMNGMGGGGGYGGTPNFLTKFLGGGGGGSSYGGWQANPLY